MSEGVGVGDGVGLRVNVAFMIPFPLMVAIADGELALSNLAALAGEAVQAENVYPFAAVAKMGR